MDCRRHVSTLAQVACLFAAACGPDGWNLDPAAPGAVQQAIINGYQCGADELETAVAIIVDADINILGTPTTLRSVMCTGTLIAPDVVMAAAHCVDPAAIESSLFGLGTISRMDLYISFQSDLAALAVAEPGTLLPFPDDAMPSALAIPHPGFDINSMGNVAGPGDYKDISLIFLVDPVTTVQPEVVIAPDEIGQLVVDVPVQIAGWGQQTVTSNPMEPPPAGTVGIKRCADSFVGEVGDYEMQIGGDSSTSRKCHGDSGGPTYLTVETEHARTRRVVGVTSHAYDSSDCAKGGVDTRVDVWLDWIDEQMRAGCDNGNRSWCQVTGIIPPAYYDSSPQSDGGNGDDTHNPLDPLGCGCRAAGAPATAIWALALVGALVLRRRARG
ncbi:MAG: trypsin-like serine protease [Deltaproteobacteria bacterium]|nr:trypsin-like serine protease [Deltaproteobacteria bacterium]